MRGREEGERLGTPSRGGQGLTSLLKLRLSETRRPFCSEDGGWAWGQGEGVTVLAGVSESQGLETPAILDL